MTLNLTLMSLAFFTRNEKLVIFRAGKSMSRVLLSGGRLISRQGEELIGVRKLSAIVTSEEALSVGSVQVIMASFRWIKIGRQKKLISTRTDVDQSNTIYVERERSYRRLWHFKWDGRNNVDPLRDN